MTLEKHAELRDLAHEFRTAVEQGRVDGLRRWACLRLLDEAFLGDRDPDAVVDFVTAAIRA